MKIQHLALALTIVNVLLLIFLVTRAPLPADGTAPVLRGHALEIVDGLVGASPGVMVELPDR